jgi:thiol-disulfide isomerase/thioredoxin
MIRKNPILLRSGCLGWALVLGSLLFVTPADAGLVEGDAVGAFSLEKGGGGTFEYPVDAKGKVVFVNFWASWCPECKIELPELVAIREKYRDRPFVLLAVNMDRKRKAADKFLEKAGLDLVVLYDNEQKVINAFAPVGVPASYLVGPTGEVEKVYVGFKKDYIEKYIKDIEALLIGTVAEETPAAETAEEVSQP